jgi:sarcosine oxidase subunit beta
MGQILTPGASDFSPADAVVVGGGIVGVATAFWLSRAGMNVVLVEMRSELASLTSSASIESFRLQFTEPGMFQLAGESIDMFENFQTVVGLPELDISIRRQGYLFMTDDEGMLPDLKNAFEQYRKLGLSDVELLTGDEVRKKFPYVSPAVVGATFRQNDGWLAFHEVVQAFAKACDAKFFMKTRVTDIETDTEGVRAVVTDRGRLPCRIVVDAAGPFAGRIGEMVGLQLPLEPVRRQKAYIAAEAVPADAPLVIDLVTNSYWRPEAGGALLGWVDPDEPVTEPMEEPSGDWDFAAIVMDKAARLSPFWEKIMENIRQQDVDVSAGQYVYTPDDQPLIGPVTDVPGFYLNCGYWAGMMLSAGAGRWVADLATGKMKNSDNPLRYSRFEEGIATAGGAFLRGH